MKRFNQLLFSIFLCVFCFAFANFAARQELISFDYQDEDLVNVIHFIASKKDINVVLPMRADDKIKEKLTWSLDKKITPDEAWNLLKNNIRYSWLQHHSLS